MISRHEIFILLFAAMLSIIDSAPVAASGKSCGVIEVATFHNLQEGRSFREIRVSFGWVPGSSGPSQLIPTSTPVVRPGLNSPDGQWSADSDGLRRVDGLSLDYKALGVISPWPESNFSGYLVNPVLWENNRRLLVNVLRRSISAIDVADDGSATVQTLTRPADYLTLGPRIGDSDSFVYFRSTFFEPDKGPFGPALFWNEMGLFNLHDVTKITPLISGRTNLVYAGQTSSGLLFAGFEIDPESFRTDGDPPWVIWLLHGSKVRKVSTVRGMKVGPGRFPPESLSWSLPAVSPDGRLIAVASADFLYVVNVATGAVRRFTPPSTFLGRISSDQFRIRWLYDGIAIDQERQFFLDGRQRWSIFEKPESAVFHVVGPIGPPCRQYSRLDWFK